MADKKVQIEVLDFEAGDSIESVSIIDGGQFLATPVVIFDNGSGNPSPILDATFTVNTSGSGTVSSPFTITSISVTDGGSGYLSTARALITTISPSDTISVAVVVLNLNTGIVGMLDVTDSQNFPLSINFTVSDGKNLENRFGDFSKTFEIPATKNNSRIFNHIYNSQIVNTKNIYSQKNCRILVDSIEFFVGKIQIQGSLQDKNPKSYSCTIYGGNFSWVSDIADKRMCDLQFATAGTQTYDYTNINNSWTKTQANSEVVYPLVSYGDFYPTSSDGGVNMYDTTDFEQDWRGWFWVYNLLKEIFRNIGFAIESTFIETATFKKLITHFNWLNDNDDANRLEAAFSPEINRTGSGYQNLVGNFSALTYVNLNDDFSNLKCIYNTEVTDGAGQYDNTSGTWTCGRAGFYEILASANIAYVMNNAALAKQSAHTVDLDFKIVHKNSSGTIQNTYVTNVINGTNPVHSVTPSNRFVFYTKNVDTNGYKYFAENDTVEVMMDIVSSPDTTSPAGLQYALGFGGATGSQAFPTHQARFKVNHIAQTLTIGQTFKLRDMLPCDIKQIDFIKGIAHLFNLQFYTSVQSKKVYIEPYNDFYGDADTAYNWSSKLDYSQPIKDKYEIGLSEEIVFKYKDDSNDKYLDYLNKDESGNRLRFPKYAYNQNLGNNFPKGIKEFINPLFSPTQQEWDNDTRTINLTNGTLIPVLFKDIPFRLTLGFDSAVTQVVERPEKEDKFAPRIAYYHGYVTNPNSSNHPTAWSRVNSPISYVQNSSYPRATFVDWEDSSFASLSYNDEEITPPLSGTTTTVTGLYNIYYKKMIKQMLKSPRIREVYINLKIKDVINIDMRRLVFLDGSMWRINKIVDFSPAKNITTKVELIQWFEV